MSFSILLAAAATSGCQPSSRAQPDDDEVAETKDAAATMTSGKKDSGSGAGSAKSDTAPSSASPDVASQTERVDVASSGETPKDAAATSSPDAGAAADGAAPADAGDGTFDYTITSTSMSFRMKVLPVLIKRCGACHEYFKDPMGPSADKANADEIRALQWVRGKTICAKAVVKEKALVNPERKTNKDLFDDLESAKKSYIWHKLTNAADICGSPMPKPAAGAQWQRLAGDDKTPNTDLFIIFDWIAHGAG